LFVFVWHKEGVNRLIDAKLKPVIDWLKPENKLLNPKIGAYLAHAFA
jgi:hypothetical protein